MNAPIAKSRRNFWRGLIASPLFWMVAVGVVLRVALILFFRYYDFSPENEFFAEAPFTPDAIRHFPFGFGYETGSVAYSLATGHGFSSPFGGPTGPTAWLAPVYPALCAVVFKIFGSFTLTAGFVMLSINSLFAALTCIPICRIGELTVGRKAGLLSGWMWSAGLFFMYWPTTWVWEVSLSALLLSILFLQSLRLASDPGWKAWARFGLVWGLAALTNPALLAFLPASGLYPAYRLWKNRQLPLRAVSVSALIFMLCIAPWLVRNRVVFGQWIFIRGNAPFEISLGNYHLSNGMGWYGKHPSQNKFEYAKYQHLGEVAYVAQKKQIVSAFIRQYPREFVDLCLTRMTAFWLGSVLTTERWWLYWFFQPLSALTLLGLIAILGSKADGVWLYFWLLLSYPVTYYLAFAQPRYRHAIEPEMLLLATYLVHGAIRDFSARFSAYRQSQAIVGSSRDPRHELLSS
jgi:hypothetical protein